MTTMTNDELALILAEAVKGDKLSEQNLLLYIRNHIMNRRIGRFLGRNRLVDNDDIRQEFMIGVALAIRKVDMNIGDPVEYILAQGVYRVRTSVRSSITKNTVQVCCECGTVTRLNLVNGQYVCKKCGSTNIETTEVHDSDEIAMENTVDTAEPLEDDVTWRMLIEEFEATLTEGSNVKALYDLLKSGIDRDDPQTKNYTKEIARLWGGCSEQNVVQTLIKLRHRLTVFAEERGFEIRGNRFIEKE